MDDMKIKIAVSDEDREIIKNFRLMDDSFMEICFRDNKEAVELVLRIILNKELTVINVKTQDGLQNLIGRSVRLDITAVDSEGTVYNIEIQRSDKGGSAKHARYNSSMLDTLVTEPGDDYEKLPESYVIFITEHDVMGEGLPLYEFTYTENKTHKQLGDGSHILYVNNEYRDNSELGRLMSDFAESDPDKMNFEVLAKTARFFKEDKRGVADMCRVMEEKFEQGVRQGKAQERLEMIRNLMHSLGFSAEKAMEVLCIPKGEWDQCLMRLQS